MALLSIPGIQVALVLTSTRLWTSNIHVTFLPVSSSSRTSTRVTSAWSWRVFPSGVVAAAMAPTAGFRSRALSPQIATIVGLACGGVDLVIAPLATTMPWVFATPVLIGIGTGLSLPLLITLVTTATPLTQRGRALGLRGVVNQAASTAAPLIVGPLMTALGLGLGFAAGGGIGLGLLAAAAVVHHRRQQTPLPDAGEA